MLFSHQDSDEIEISSVDDKYFETKSSNSTNNHVTASPSAKRKRVEPSSLSEQEQIELAIGKSIWHETGWYKSEIFLNIPHQIEPSKILY